MVLLQLSCVIRALAEDREYNIIPNRKVCRDKSWIHNLHRRVGCEVLVLDGGDKKKSIIGFDGVSEVGIRDGTKSGVDGVARTS